MQSSDLITRQYSNIRQYSKIKRLKSTDVYWGTAKFLEQININNMTFLSSKLYLLKLVSKITLLIVWLEILSPFVFLCLFLDSQPQRLQEISRICILQNVLNNSNNTVKQLDGLPIPRVLIKYLKYYRDENRPKPERRRKKRRREVSDDEGDNDGDDGDNDDVGDNDDNGVEIDIRFRVVIR